MFSDRLLACRGQLNVRFGRSILATNVEEQAGAIHPFSAAIPHEALVGLQRRFAATRWASREIVGERSLGVQLAAVPEVWRYWANESDLGRVEARLNALQGPELFAADLRAAFRSWR
jgi:Epoxide hydrolase N terminus